MHQAPQPPHDGLRPGLRNPAAGSASAPARPGPQRPPLALHAGRASSARVKGEARAFLTTDRDARAGRRPGGGEVHAREDGQEGRARACGDKWEGRARACERGLARCPKASLAFPLGTWPPAGSTTRYGNPD